MREIILDTETTGLDPRQGHRIVEIGALEIYNLIPTGKTYHVYLNPQRDMPEEAFRVHGLSDEFLADKPLFGEVVEDFLTFVGDSSMVIHNAPFDLKFLNYELKKVKKPEVLPHLVVDTLKIARKKYPGSPASLDALCRRFQVDNANRSLHGALLDSELLAQVYLELRGGKQPDLTLKSGEKPIQEERTSGALHITSRSPRMAHAPHAEEVALHEKLLGKLKNPLWRF